MQTRSINNTFWKLWTHPCTILFLNCLSVTALSIPPGCGPLGLLPCSLYNHCYTHWKELYRDTSADGLAQLGGQCGIQGREGRLTCSRPWSGLFQPWNSSSSIRGRMRETRGAWQGPEDKASASEWPSPQRGPRTATTVPTAFSPAPSWVRTRRGPAVTTHIAAHVQLEHPAQNTLTGTRTFYLKRLLRGRRPWQNSPRPSVSHS